MSQRDRSSRQHGLEAPLEVGLHLMRPTWVPPDVFPHHVDHRSPDQTVLDYEREEIRFRVLHDRPHYVHPAARIRRDLLVRQRLRVSAEIRAPIFAAVRLIVQVEDLMYLIDLPLREKAKQHYSTIEYLVRKDGFFLLPLLCCPPEARRTVGRSTTRWWKVCWLWRWLWWWWRRWRRW